MDDLSRATTEEMKAHDLQLGLDVIDRMRAEGNDWSSRAQKWTTNFRSGSWAAWGGVLLASIPKIARDSLDSIGEAFPLLL